MCTVVDECYKQYQPQLITVTLISPPPPHRHFSIRNQLAMDHQNHPPAASTLILPRTHLRPHDLPPPLPDPLDAFPSPAVCQTPALIIVKSEFRHFMTSGISLCLYPPNRGLRSESEEGSTERMLEGHLASSRLLNNGRTTGINRISGRAVDVIM